MPATRIGALAGSLIGQGGFGGSSWKDRIQPASYEPPSGSSVAFGATIGFSHNSQSRVTPLRTTVFEFPGVEGGFVQQNGIGPRRYPLTCYFNGANHDVTATMFEAGLIKPGRGKLLLPFFPPLLVMPVGEITRREDLVEEANQTIIEVTFSTSLAEVYPSATPNAQNEILAAVDAYDIAAAAKFEASMVLDTASQIANAKATIRRFLNLVSSKLAVVSDTLTDASRAFNDDLAIINQGLDTFINEPLLLAQHIMNLQKGPARALAALEDRLEGFLAVALDIFNSIAGNPGQTLEPGTALPARTVRTANDFHIADVFACGSVSASMTAVAATPITGAPDQGGGTKAPGAGISTRPQALKAADEVLRQVEALQEFRAAGITALEGVPTVTVQQVDDGDVHYALEQAAALTAGRLVQASFSLVPERRLVLGRPRTAVDLVWELYGSVDDRLDFLAASNDFSGDDWLELERGRLIKYYPRAA